MPWSEIQGVLTADDVRVVYRYLELHRERLQEQLAEELRKVSTIERILTELQRANA